MGAIDGGRKAQAAHGARIETDAPKEIQQEIVSLIDFLIRNPVVIVKEGKTISI